MLSDPSVPAPAVEAWSADESEERAAERIVLGGHMVPSLVEIDPLSVRIEPDDPPVGDETTNGSAVIEVVAEIEHDLDATVIDLQLGVAVLSRRNLDVVWDRLHAPALRVLPSANDEPLPSPLAAVTGGLDGRVRRGEAGEIEVREELESLPLSRAQPLSYLVAIGGYELESPSVDDVVRILEHGGPIDLSALATWATQAGSEETLPFDDDARGRIMDSVEKVARALRSPPAWGDFARLAALTAVAQACARPEDLERMLALQRPMGILLASGIVSWDAAANEEHAVGVAIHGFSVHQSRSQAAISWELALKRLRITALDRLLRLAYDPIDFRNAPATARRSPLQSLADDLLAPLVATQVERVLSTAADEATEAAILRYYVEVHHEAVAEPLVDWLIAHPARVDDVGVASLDVLARRSCPCSCVDTARWMRPSPSANCCGGCWTPFPSDWRARWPRRPTRSAWTCPPMRTASRRRLPTSWLRFGATKRTCVRPGPTSSSRACKKRRRIVRRSASASAPPLSSQRSRPSGFPRSPMR